MGAPADRLNRVLLALLGLLLLAAGVLTLVRSFGGLGSSLADDPVLGAPQERLFQDYSPWAWIGVAVVAGLLALLALRWLLAQLRTDRAGDLELETDDRRGSTTLHPGAVTAAVCEEVESYRGVRAASARLLHDARHPELVLQVDLEARADIAQTRERVENEAVAHVRQALELAQLRTRLVLRPTARERR